MNGTREGETLEPGVEWTLECREGGRTEEQEERCSGQPGDARKVCLCPGS